MIKEAQPVVIADIQQLRLLSLSDFVHVLMRARRRIGLGAVVGLSVGLTLALILPASYTATASFVPPGTTGGATAMAMMGQLSALGAGSLLGGHSQGDLYVGILKSQTTARYLIQRFDLQKVYRVSKTTSAEKRLASNSLFAVGSKDNIVTISVTDHDPRLALALARGYLDALQKASEKLALTESSQRRAFYEQRLAHEKDQLEDAEVAFKQSEERTGLISPAGQTLSNLQSQQRIQSEIGSLQARLAVNLQSETEENPDVKALRSQISSLQTQAAQSASGRASEQFGQLSTAQVPELQLEYIRKALEVKYHETLFDILAKQYEAARLDEAKEAPLQILDEPVLPDSRSGPKRSLLVLAGVLIGTLVTSAWVLWRA